MAAISLDRLRRLWKIPWIKGLVRLSVAFGLLGLLFIQIDLHDVLQTLSQINIMILALLIVSWLGMLYTQAWQVALVVRPLGLQVSRKEVFEVYWSTRFYSLVMPAGAVGGLIWYRLAHPTGNVIKAGLLLVFVRVLHTSLLLGIGVAGVWFDAELRSSSFGVLAGVLLLAGLAVVMVFLVPGTATLFAPVVRGLTGPPMPQRIAQKIDKVWQSVLAFQKLPLATTAGVLGLSLTNHGIGAARIYLAALAVGIQQPIVLLCWVYIVVYVATLLPISFAGLGVRDVGVVVLLSQYGVPEAQALSMSLVLFSVLVLVGLAGGLVEAKKLWSNPARFRAPTATVNNNHFIAPRHDASEE